MLNYQHDTRLMQARETIQKLTASLLRKLLCEYVLHPEHLKVEAVGQRDMFSIRITPDPLDAGRVLGRKGANAAALSTIVRHMARRYGFDGHLERIVLPFDGVPGRDKYPPLNVQTLDTAAIVELMREVCQHCLRGDTVDITVVPATGPGEATVLILAGADEPLALVEQMQLAMQVIFEKIGKVRGMVLHVYLKNEAPPETRQPNHNTKL